MEDGDEERFLIEKIVKHRKESDGSLSYWVKWVGYPPAQNSWVPLHQILIDAREVLTEYENARVEKLEEDQRQLLDLVTDSTEVFIQLANKFLEQESQRTQQTPILMPSQSTEKRSYVCEVCEKKCSRSDSLKRHMMTQHSSSRASFAEKEKPSTTKYECYACRKEFSSISVLKKHIARIHPSNPLLRWPCPICSKQFKTAYNHRDHMNKMHQK